MDHSTVITNNPDGFGQPIHVQCACGTAGDFSTVEEASAWINVKHFPRLGATETFSLADSSVHSAPSPTPASTLASPPEPEAGVEKETLGAA